MARGASTLDRPRIGAWIKFLRVLFKVINMLLALIGLAMVAFSIDMFVKFRATKHTLFPGAPLQGATAHAPPSSDIGFLGASHAQNTGLLEAQHPSNEAVQRPGIGTPPTPLMDRTAGVQRRLQQQQWSFGASRLMRSSAASNDAPIGVRMVGPAARNRQPIFAGPRRTQAPREPMQPNPEPDPPEPDPPGPPSDLPAPPPPKQKKVHSPWFIYAFAGAGLLTLLTACTGLVGVRLNSRVLLGFYSSLLVVMLLGQAAVAIACFADDEWSKHLPPDETGEAKKLWEFIHARLAICKWLGLIVFAIQVLSVVLAFALSSAQQAALDNLSDEEDEVWGRRRPMLSRSLSGGERASGAVPAIPRQLEDDPWSARMREKYGLDVSQFTYSPLRGQAQPPSSSLVDQDGDVTHKSQSRGCSIM